MRRVISPATTKRHKRLMLGHTTRCSSRFSNQPTEISQSGKGENSAMMQKTEGIRAGSPPGSRCGWRCRA